MWPLLPSKNKDNISEKLFYCDIGEITSFIVDKVKVKQTKIFQPFFDNIESILCNCDKHIEDLIVVDFSRVFKILRDRN